MPEKSAKSDIWQGDALNRKADAEFLSLFLQNRILERQIAGLPASYVLNIDARWGQGKTYFLDRFAKSLQNEGFVVARVDAWKDDHADDPLLAVMDAIDVAVAPLIQKNTKARKRWQVVKETGGAIAVAAIKGAVIQGSRKLIGAGVDEIAEMLKAPSGSGDKAADEAAKSIGEFISERGKILLGSFREGKRTIASFRENLKAFLVDAGKADQKLPLFVFVDELDRCRPPFAIAMLERIKHLFEIDNVVFVVATDTSQLTHSIGAVYGAEFDGGSYLSRFFNRSFSFAPISRRLFVEELCRRLPLNADRISLPPDAELLTFLSDGFDYFALPLRDIEQVYDILRSFFTTWTYKCKIELVPLLPIAIAYQQKRTFSSPDFSSTMNQIAQRYGGTQRKWKTTFNKGRYDSAPEEVDYLSLASDFINRAGTPLPDINYQVSAAYSHWVAQRLSDEFALVHGNTFQRVSPPFSLIKIYYDVIRSAGRLSADGQSS